MEVFKCDHKDPVSDSREKRTRPHRAVLNGDPPCDRGCMEQGKAGYLRSSFRLHSK